MNANTLLDDSSALQRVGISHLHEGRLVAHLKLRATDFIVEEIRTDGSLITIEPDQILTTDRLQDFSDSVELELVKICATTEYAMQLLSRKLGIHTRFMHYAGKKDQRALTAQLFTLSKVTSLERLADPIRDASAGVYIKQPRQTDTQVAPGHLRGNRFCVVMRPWNPISKLEALQITKEMARLKTEGYWNFFYLQRFGRSRLLSHWLGRDLARGDYERALKRFLTEHASTELEQIQEARCEMSEAWGRWAAMLSIALRYPYVLREEIKILKDLKKNPGDHEGVVRRSSRRKPWWQAYTSYLFNVRLSELIEAGDVPQSMALPSSSNRQDWEPYERLLRRDGVPVFGRQGALDGLIGDRRHQRRTRVRATIHGQTLRRNLLVFDFSLQKGAYATGMLANVFQLASGDPPLATIFSDEVDAKSMMGRGSIRAALERFGLEFGVGYASGGVCR